jgi:hypothetical protein
MRDGNKISGQCTYVTARSCTSTICVATRTSKIVYIDSPLRLLGANHLSFNKIQRRAHDFPCSNGLDSLGVCVISTEHL